MNHKTSREHYEKYHAFYLKAPAQFKAQARSIILDQAGEPKSNAQEVLTRYYNADPILNNTFRRSGSHFENYDCYYETNRRICKGISLAENVCIIKHAMIYGILEATPEFKD